MEEPRRTLSILLRTSEPLTELIRTSKPLQWSISAIRFFKVCSPLSAALISRSLAEYAIVGNLMDYLTSIWSVDLAYAAITINIKEGFASLVSLLVTVFVDACFGRYRMLLVSMAINILGLLVLTLHIWAARKIKPLFYIALFIIALGEGGIDCTLTEFGTDQFEMYLKDAHKVNTSVACWWYTGTFIGTAVGTFIASYPVSKLIYWWIRGSLCSTIAMLVAFCVVVGGTLLYNRAKPGGSYFMSMLRVLWVALVRPLYHQNKHGMYQTTENDALPWGHEEGRLSYSNCLRCLNKATISDDGSQATKEIKWKVCTPMQVEETKMFLCLFPIWITFLMYGLVRSMGATFFIVQGSELNGSLPNGYQVAANSLLIVSGFSELLVSQTLLPFLVRLCQLKHGIPPTLRIGAGLFLGTICCFVASSIEKRRLHVFWNCVHSKKCDQDSETPMRIFWLVPQYSLLGVMEGLVRNGVSDFYNDQVLEPMRSREPVFSESVVGMGSVLSVLAILLTNKLGKVGGRPIWFADKINDSHLDRYYFTIGVLGLINICFFAYSAKRYPWNKVKEGGAKLQPENFSAEAPKEEQEEQDLAAEPEEEAQEDSEEESIEELE